VLRAALERVQSLDPSRTALPRRTGRALPAGLVCVYRSRNAAVVSSLLAGLPSGVTVRLWCLDTPPAALQDLTVGSGPGTRFALLNALVETIPAPDRVAGLVLCDDDYVFRVGSLEQLLRTGPAFGLDVWQPGHSASSWVSYPFVRRRANTFLRRTTFVEQGPVVVLSARAQELLLPLPEDLGMGWGVEVRWTDTAAAHQLGMAIVDAASIRHLSPPGVAYDRAAESAQLAATLAAGSRARVEDLQQEVHRVTPGAARRLRTEPA
jgi:hypothetical protein